MTGFELIAIPGHGPEDIAIAADGSAYTGTRDGSIIRIDPDRTAAVVANTGGGPYGIEIAPDGRLVVCDTFKGLLLVDPTTGAVETLVDEYDGQPIRACNNAHVGSDGTIWFSDSFTGHHMPQWRRDMIANPRTGRLFRRRPDSGVELVLAGLAFANGVVLAADESWVAVAESTDRCIVRYWLDGPRAGGHEQFLTNLPGYPDNLSRGSDGLLWVALAGTTMRSLTLAHALPRWMSRAASRLPTWLQPPVPRRIRVQAYTDAGELVHDIDLKHRAFYMVTGARENNGRLWLGTLERSAVAVLEVPRRADTE